jgi:hypothetical protein
MIGHARRLFPALLLLLGACVGAEGLAGRPAAAAPDSVSETVEQGGKFIAFVGPRQIHGEPHFGVAGTNFYALRSWIDRRSGETLYQIYVQDSYSGPKRQWNSAQDAQGQKLRFVPISVNEIECGASPCAYAEEFAAALPEATLRASPQGVPVFFAAQSGAQMAIPIAGDLIAKQLGAVDRVRAATAIATPAAAAAPALPVAASAAVSR